MLVGVAVGAVARLAVALPMRRQAAGVAVKAVRLVALRLAVLRLVVLRLVVLRLAAKAVAALDRVAPGARAVAGAVVAAGWTSAPSLNSSRPSSSPN